MIQGTTPIHKFNVNIDTNLIAKLRISYEQNGKIVLRKEKKDCEFDGNTIITQLEQEETIKFDAPGNVRIQLHALTENDEALVTMPFSIPVYILLDKAVL